MGALAERHLFEFDGGTPALEFVNTMSGLRVVNPQDWLTEYADLAFWALQMGLIDDARMKELAGEAERHPRKAQQALAAAIAAREALHDVLLAAIEEREPPAPALDAVNAWIAEALRHRRLRPRGPRQFETVYDEDGDLLAFLRPVAADAADLLERQLPSGRVRRCEESLTGHCGWLFLDQTRNRSRRFCTMDDCGNRAKQRRHWRRHKEGAS